MEYVRHLFPEGTVVKGKEDDIAIAVIGVSENGAITVTLLKVGKPWAEQGAEEGQEVVLRPIRTEGTIACWVPNWSFAKFMLTPGKTLGF
ncbi:MAG: hypothetical protein Q8P01_00255 [bacterium]|nr:hypothetical protein [bacterium]